MKVITTLFFITASLSVIAQQSPIEFNIEKDTVSYGELYKNDVSVKLAPGDSLIAYQVSSAGMTFPVKGNTAKVAFSAIFNYSYSSRVIQNAYPLRIKLKTQKIDTLINKKVKYYVIPNPAYVYWKSEGLDGAEVFPDTVPILISHQVKTVDPTLDIKTIITSAILKGEKGSLAFSFLIDTNGTAGRLKLLHNTFKSVTKEKLQQYINATKWTPGKKNGKVVKTVYGVHIVE